MANADDWQSPFTSFAEKRDADFFLFSGPIYEAQADKLINSVRKLKVKRTHAALALCTRGGNADCAFQIARILKRRYKTFVLYVFGECKSAGTLVAVGANEIVMSEFGQFGPLDVQLADKEELFGQTPALDVQQSLATLSKFTFDTFTSYFVELAGSGLSTKIAAEVAKNLALGMTSPISGQIDPLLLGRVDRSMKIAKAYSERLQKDFKSKDHLSGGYPSHSFVIDYDEAKDIFPALREPDDVECGLEDLLRQWGRVPAPKGEWIGLLSKEKQLATPATTNEAKPDSAGERSGDGSAKSQSSQTATGTTVGAAAS